MGLNGGLQHIKELILGILKPWIGNRADESIQPQPRRRRQILPPGTGEITLVVHNKIVTVSKGETIGNRRIILQTHIQNLHGESHLPLAQIQLLEILLRNGHHLGRTHQGDRCQPGVGGADQAPQRAHPRAIGLHRGGGAGLSCGRIGGTGDSIVHGSPLRDCRGDGVGLGDSGAEIGQVISSRSC